MSERIDPQRETRELHPTDGRRRRYQRTRERILSTLVEVVAEPGLEPSLQNLVARSGISMSTLLRHFGDSEGVFEAVGDAVRGRVIGHLSAGPYEGDRVDRVDEVVRRLAAIYETTSPYHKVLLRYRDWTDRHTLARENMRRVTRSQIEQSLAKELESAPPETADVLSVVASMGAWTEMRDFHGLTTDRASHLMRSAILCILDASEQP